MQDASLGPILTNMSADLKDVFGQNSRRREQSRELEIYVQNVNAVMPGLITAAELIASTVRFLYFNKSNLAMKSTLYMLPHEELEVMLNRRQGSVINTDADFGACSVQCRLVKQGMSPSLTFLVSSIIDIVYFFSGPTGTQSGRAERDARSV